MNTTPLILPCFLTQTYQSSLVHLHLLPSPKVFDQGKGQMVRNSESSVTFNSHKTNQSSTKTFIRIIKALIVCKALVRIKFLFELICYPNKVNKKVNFKLKISVYSLLSAKASSVLVKARWIRIFPQHDMCLSEFLSCQLFFF